MAQQSALDQVALFCLLPGCTLQALLSNDDLFSANARPKRLHAMATEQPTNSTPEGQQAEHDPVYLMAEATAQSVGNEFLSALVHSMHSVMPVALAIITNGIGTPPRRARAVFSWKDGDLGVPIEYDLEGTPCDYVYLGQHIIIPEQLLKKFPKEPARRQSYCGVPLRDAIGEVFGHFAVFADEPISDPARTESMMRIFGMRVEAEFQRMAREAERDRLIERLGQQHRALRQANEFKSELVGMVAHDLRSPLSAIVSRAEFIQAITQLDRSGDSRMTAEERSEKITSSTDAIHAASTRMEKMLEDMLTSAREEATSISLNLTEFNVCEPIRTAIELNTDAAAAKGISINLSDSPSVQITADEDRLIEAIDNLLSNAVKYSPYGADVSVAVELVPDNNDVIVRVADYGQGMDAQDLANVFRRFFTLSARPTGDERSTGIGLTIVKTIAEAHGGDVDVQSEGKGKGALFSLRIPRTRSTVEE